MDTLHQRCRINSGGVSNRVHDLPLLHEFKHVFKHVWTHCNRGVSSTSTPLTTPKPLRAPCTHPGASELRMSHPQTTIRRCDLGVSSPGTATHLSVNTDTVSYVSALYVCLIRLPAYTSVTATQVSVNTDTRSSPASTRRPAPHTSHEPAHHQSPSRAAAATPHVRGTVPLPGCCWRSFSCYFHSRHPHSRHPTLPHHALPPPTLPHHAPPPARPRRPARPGSSRPAALQHLHIRQTYKADI